MHKKPLHSSTASSDRTNTGIGSPLRRATISRAERGTNGIPTNKRPTAIASAKDTNTAIVRIVLRNMEILAHHYCRMVFVRPKNTALTTHRSVQNISYDTRYSGLVLINGIIVNWELGFPT